MSELLIKEKPRKAHTERGDPAKIAVLNERQNCAACGKDIDEGDTADLSLLNYSFYCDKGNCSPPVGSKPDGLRKISNHYEVFYFETKKREKVRQEILEKYDEEGYDKPGEEQLETMVDKRLENKKSQQEEFEKEAVPVTSL